LDLEYKTEQEWKDHYAAVRKRIANAAVIAKQRAIEEKKAKDKIEEERKAKASKVEEQIVLEYSKHAPLCRRILIEVATKHNLPVGDVRGEKRKNRFVLARHEAFYRFRVELGWSYPKIGTFFNRDHTSIYHGVMKYAERNNLKVPKVE